MAIFIQEKSCENVVCDHIVPSLNIFMVFNWSGERDRGEGVACCLRQHTFLAIGSFAKYHHTSMPIAHQPKICFVCDCMKHWIKCILQHLLWCLFHLVSLAENTLVNVSSGISSGEYGYTLQCFTRHQSISQDSRNAQEKAFRYSFHHFLS